MYQHVGLWGAGNTSETIYNPKLISWTLELSDEGSYFGHVNKGEIVLLVSLISSTDVDSNVLAHIVLIVDWDIPGQFAQNPRDFVHEDYCYILLSYEPDSALVGLLLKRHDGNLLQRLGLFYVSSHCCKPNWLLNANRVEVRIQ
jgi:hypothetical protein